MILNDAMILLFAFIALIGPAVFLIFLNRLPRRWRLGIYLLCIAMHLFAALVLSSLSWIERNCASGKRAQHFFESLQQQLAAGTVHRGFLELPGYAAGVILKHCMSAGRKHHRTLQKNAVRAERQFQHLCNGTGRRQ